MTSCPFIPIDQCPYCNELHQLCANAKHVPLAKCRDCRLHHYLTDKEREAADRVRTSDVADDEIPLGPFKGWNGESVGCFIVAALLLLLTAVLQTCAALVVRR